MPSPVEARESKEILEQLHPHPPRNSVLKLLLMRRCNRVTKTSLGSSNCTFRHNLEKTASNADEKKGFVQNSIYHFHMTRFPFYQE